MQSEQVTESRMAVVRKLAEWTVSGEEVILVLLGGAAPMHFCGQMAGTGEVFVFCGHGMRVFLALKQFAHVRLDEHGGHSGVHLHRRDSDDDGISICCGPTFPG